MVAVSDESSAGHESKGFARLAPDPDLVVREADQDGGVPDLTSDQVRLQRYKRMLGRAGYSASNHVPHLDRIQNNQGADSIKLGAVSGQLYKDIFRSRAFDEFYFQIPPPKSSLELMSAVARKILSKDPAAAEKIRKEEEEEAKLGGHYAGANKQRDPKEDAKLSRIGYKPDSYGPPGLAPPQRKILNSEGRHKYFSYDGDWVDGHMSGYGTYRFADGMTYEGVMRDDRPCGEGTARYRNGGVYEGRWKDGFCEGYGKLTSPTGTFYEGSWREGRRHGKGRLVFKSGSVYEGDFFLGTFHGRGRFKSANLDVTYDGWWNSGFVCGHGTLIMPDGTRVVRRWPAQSRYGGGLSVKGAMEMIRLEQEEACLGALDDKRALYGVAELVELNFLVKNVRRNIAERRAEEKAAKRNELFANRRAATKALLEAKMKALLDEEEAAEPDDITKEFL